MAFRSCNSLTARGGWTTALRAGKQKFKKWPSLFFSSERAFGLDAKVPKGGDRSHPSQGNDARRSHGLFFDPKVCCQRRVDLSGCQRTAKIGHDERGCSRSCNGSG